jgi:uncharacterized damage-inducible protein DinB
MTWVAPAVERQDVPHQGDELSLVTAFLEFHRETFLWKCAGLTGDQLAVRPVASSGMSLLGLIRHLTDVERHWLRIVTVGEEVPFCYWGQPDTDSDFDDASAATAEGDYAAFLAELDVCRENQNIDLDSTIVRPEYPAYTYRWILIHLIEEYARHNGHADLFREAIDGAAGE